MKRVFFVTALSMGVFFVHAQRTHTTAEFGVKGGLNVSNVSVENSTNPDSKASVNLGIFAHVHVAPMIAFQPELLFSGQGYKETVAGVDYNTSLNYITLPILVQLMVGEGFRLETGPQPGILVSAHDKSGGNSANAKDDFKSADFSWVFGVGYIGRAGFGVDARYNIGLSNINDFSSTNVRNRVFALGVFYQFRR